ncbi:hypothetical protein EDD76_12153 [Kineothrix alysoides]|uniref:Uncharacterized protein n=1 Tax=Kineothrix alysoides TaxID=1469948 RepID=A0A4R1QMU7_9FIRM|nr:hypothetical protein EDD76_12153 [Kineothrix alysoides]
MVYKTNGGYKLCNCQNKVKEKECNTSENGHEIYGGSLYNDVLYF